jgi:hypothetical protein
MSVQGQRWGGRSWARRLLLHAVAPFEWGGAASVCPREVGNNTRPGNGVAVDSPDKPLTLAKVRSRCCPVISCRASGSVSHHVASRVPNDSQHRHLSPSEGLLPPAELPEAATVLGVARGFRFSRRDSVERVSAHRAVGGSVLLWPAWMGWLLQKRTPGEGAGCPLFGLIPPVCFETSRRSPPSAGPESQRGMEKESQEEPGCQESAP